MQGTLLEKVKRDLDATLDQIEEMEAKLANKAKVQHSCRLFL